MFFFLIVKAFTVSLPPGDPHSWAAGPSHWLNPAHVFVTVHFCRWTEGLRIPRQTIFRSNFQFCLFCSQNQFGPTQPSIPPGSVNEH